MVCFDVGAKIGAVSLHLACLTGPSGKVFLLLRPWLRGVPVLVTDSCGIAPMIDKRAGFLRP